MPDDGLLVPDKFYADYPLWTLCDTTINPGAGAGMIPPIRLPDFGGALAVFTDKDLVCRFIADTRRPNTCPLRIESPDAMIKIIEFFQQKGCAYVALDPVANPPSAVIHPIGEFLADARHSGGSN